MPSQYIQSGRAPKSQSRNSRDFSELARQFAHLTQHLASLVRLSTQLQGPEITSGVLGNQQRLPISSFPGPLTHSITMSANGSAVPEQASELLDKGKGKSTEQPTHEMSMEDDEDDEEEESGQEEVRFNLYRKGNTS